MQIAAAEDEQRLLLLQDHKLCGFVPVVLSLNSSTHDDLSETLPFGTPCYLFKCGPDDLGFRTEDGLVLNLIQCNSDSGEDEGKRKVLEGECSSSSKKKRRFGLVHGSLSVVHQLHALTGHKCLDIVARVVGVSVRLDGSARVVVLVDVYLPLDLWSGWQFPKLGATAASMFTHLSCNWEQRKVMLNSNGKYYRKTLEDSEIIWRHSDCHVLGCKTHCITPGSSKKKLFELHEIFRSLPGVVKEGHTYCTRIIPADTSLSSGIWAVSDDVLVNMLTALEPMDLVKVAATCHHLRSLAASIMPCMKLKLFPHQQAAVEWMLRREKNAEILAHPLYMDLSTDDGFQFYVNAVSGEIVTGIAPTVTDFHGGMFCDEPGLGKTITALSLILKTQGTFAEPPDGVEVVWCTHNNDQRCGYYELSADNYTSGNVVPSGKRVMGQNGRQEESCADICTPVGNSKRPLSKRIRSMGSDQFVMTSADSCPSKLGISASKVTSTLPFSHVLRCTRSASRVKRNLLSAYEGTSNHGKRKKVGKNVMDRRHISKGLENVGPEKEMKTSSKNQCKKANKAGAGHSDHNETWVQCDACHKWRKLPGTCVPDATTAWFCSMNSDPFYQTCATPQESWDYSRSITYLPGFYTKGTPGGQDENVSFFTSVLKEHYSSMNFETKKALTWLAKLSEDKLLEMEVVGLTRPVLDTHTISVGDSHGYHKIFKAFGLLRRDEQGTSKWYYPLRLDNLAFDVVALQIALTKPLDLFRLYLSRTTLIVVPANLIDHWMTQIRKHVRPGQLRVCVWTDHKKPSAHNLAWDYDVVITTFNRLSAEWRPRKRSILKQVHWLRVMLDEGHTLGSSLSLTNKLQMAISLTASNRWLLTGTPTPNTPNSQVSHLQPLFKFLHEEAYGQNQKSWEAGILRPFEAKMEEGRSRLLELLKRCMISARKVDLQAIPPCIKKVVFLNFTEEHARSYNELVVTVRRNILMADWKDPGHVESLLNPKQWKFRSTTIKNVRLSCCVAGHIKVTDAGEDIQETMDILVEQGLDRFSEEYVLIKISLLDGGNCLRCKEWCRLPVITPCRHLLCLECVAQDSEKCTLPGCGNLYEMQSPEILTRPENPHPKWPVPKDLIELQPSYKQDDWDPDWHATSSSKVAYLVERLKVLQEANKKMGYSLDESDNVRPCEELLFPSKKMQWSMVTHNGTFSKLNDEPYYKIPPEKVIIFSQFLEHIHVIEQQLTGSGIKFVGMYSPMHSSNKMKSLATFQQDENCMALLMDGSAALGLDLSFVNHVFLMEPIWDRSMEEQVISRAHRMGATRPINVETLAMRGTIEEQMLEFLQDPNECRRTLKEDLGRTDLEGARAHRMLHDFAESNYLAHLSFVRTNSKA